MTKLELIEQISNDLGISKKETSLVVNKFIEKIKENVENGNKVIISNFGTFFKKEISSFNVFNPRNGELMNIDNSVRINFSSSKTWRQNIKK